MSHKLHELTPTNLNLIWHENKTTYLTVTRKRGSVSLRLHRLFYDAPTPVLEAVARYAMKEDGKALAIIKQMAHLYFSTNHVEGKPLNPYGKVYNLQEILNRLLQKIPLDGVTIGWSERARRGKFRSITFGTYDKHTRQIRINPLLDDEQLPLYFLEFIIYHEMLHAVCRSQMDLTGRCSVHTKEFKELEKQFPDFEKAMEWEKGALTFFKKRKSRGRS